MTAKHVDEARWDGYAILPRRGASLIEHADGALEVSAEHEYLVEMPDQNPQEAGQALERLRDDLWLMRFGNFVGESSLGRRRLLVTSNRLSATEVEQMLDDVVSGLHALPFYFDTPTTFAYERDVLANEDVLYQAYAFIRHGLQARGPHDLRSAVERVLLDPHRRLIPQSADVPLERADRVDATTIIDLFRRPGGLTPVDPASPLASSPVAIALGQKAPSIVRSIRMIETTQTRENEFISGVLDTVRAVIDRYRKAVRSSYPDRAERLLGEPDSFMALVDSWRRHPTFQGLTPSGNYSLSSTVLRRRLGYRQVTRFFLDLLARTRLLAANDAERLLHARDAAVIYEYWCYFEVVAAVSDVLGRQPAPARFAYGTFGANVPWAYAADFGGIRVWFNRQYRAPRSYSVPLRPDVSVELSDGRLHLFDAKLKRDAIKVDAATESQIEEEEQRATYRRGDLYKMHTYRDALDAQSVWVLFPGRDVQRAEYEAPQEAADAKPRGPRGVGALPLLPGSAADRVALRQLVAEIVGRP